MNPRRGKTVTMFLAGTGLLGVIICTLVFRDDLVEWWYQIPVVRTWQDLIDQKPIDLGEGVNVRLGIEATRCPQWSGVLLYCLVEGETRDAAGHPWGLGPLTVSVTSPRGARREQAKGLVKQSREIRSSRSSKKLFARSIVIPRSGKFRAEVLSPDGKAIRSVTIHGTQAPFHPWMPFEWDTTPRPLARQSTAPDGYVTNPKHGIALPAWEGWAPHPQPTATADGPLPRLLPRDSNPRLKLQKKGNVLTVTSTRDIITSRPDRRFLSRWWVNGKLYVPAEGLLSEWYKNGTPPVGKSVVFQLKFRPERIAAKTGDKIGLQLLYTKHGWSFVDGNFERLSTLVRHNDCQPLLTNRIEFVAP